MLITDEELLARAERAEEIAERMAEALERLVGDPDAGLDVTRSGKYCFYCCESGAYQDPVAHKPDCPIAMGRKVLRAWREMCKGDDDD